MLFGEMRRNEIYNPIPWIPQMANRPVKIVTAAKFLTVGQDIDDAEVIASAYSELMDMDIRVCLFVDSKDLFLSFSTQKNSIDRSIRGYIGCTRYEYRTVAVEKVSWIPGSTNLADPLTKKDSSLTNALQLSLFSGRLCVNFDAVSETKKSGSNFG